MGVRRLLLRPLTVAALFALGLSAPAPTALHAQLAQASAAALGLGFNNTASARSFAAIAGNPAGLGHPGSAGFSLALVPVGVQAGFGPIGRGDLAAWEGRLVPDAVKAEWLTRAAEAGGQSSVVQAAGTPVAFTVGPVGLQLSSTVAGRVDLNADAVELLLYGNAGRTGQARDFALEGSSFDAVALSTVAVAFGTRVSVARELWVGVTGTYTVGHGVAFGRDAGSLFFADPLEAQFDFPAIIPRTEDAEWDNGSGVGMDLGVLWERNGLVLGATVQNVFNTFSWEPAGFSYLPAQAVVDLDGVDSDFDEQPAVLAPQALLDELDALTLKPVYSVGAQIRPSRVLRLTADVRKRTTGGIELGPEFHAGVGAELSVLSFLPVRAHVAAVSGGYQLGGGASLVLGPVNLTAGAAVLEHDREDSVLAAFTLSFGAH